MAARNLPAFEKREMSYIEDASKNLEASVTNPQEEVAVREFDPKFMRKTMLKVL